MKPIVVDIQGKAGPGPDRSGPAGNAEENMVWRTILRNLPPLNWGDAGVIAHRKPRWSRRLRRQIARLGNRGRLLVSKRPVVRTEVWRCAVR